MGTSLKIGAAKATNTPLFVTTNLTFPLDPYYYVNPTSNNSLIIRLPDINQSNLGTPFQFTIINSNPYCNFGLVPQSSNQNGVVKSSNLYNPMFEILAYQNMTPYYITSITSACIKIMYFPPHWIIMHPF